MIQVVLGVSPYHPLPMAATQTHLVRSQVTSLTEIYRCMILTMQSENSAFTFLLKREIQVLRKSSLHPRICTHFAQISCSKMLYPFHPDFPFQNTHCLFVIHIYWRYILETFFMDMARNSDENNGLHPLVMIIMKENNHVPHLFFKKIRKFEILQHLTPYNIDKIRCFCFSHIIKVNFLDIQNVHLHSIFFMILLVGCPCLRHQSAVNM